DRAEVRQASTLVGLGPDHADERVLDPAAPRAERPEQVLEVLALADDDRPPPHAEHAQELAGDRLVAAPEQAVGDGRDHERGRDQAEGGEVVPGADPEREHEQGDDDQGRDDAAEAGAVLALGVQAGPPEDEHGDERDERKPVALRVPEHAPEDRVVAVVDLPQRQRPVEAEADRDEVDGEQGRDAAEAEGERAQRAAGQEVRTAAADVLERGKAGRAFRSRTRCSVRLGFLCSHGHEEWYWGPFTPWPRRRSRAPRRRSARRGEPAGTGARAPSARP